MVYWTSMATSMTAMGAMSSCIPIQRNTLRSTMCSMKFTAWLPANPMNRAHDGLEWKVK